MAQKNSEAMDQHTQHQRKSPSPPGEFFSSKEVETLKSILGRPQPRSDNRNTTANPVRQPDQQSKLKTMFFYGSLMDPDVLRFIAQTPAAPELHKASIRGFKLKMWGPYPALIPGEPKDAVQGVYWRSEDDGQLDLLQQYETDVYRPAACAIRAGEDGSTIRDGLAFVWAGDPASDELHDGEFSLEMYQLYFKPDSFKRED